MRRHGPLLALFVLLFAFATAVVPAGAITNGHPDGTAHPNVGVMVVDFGAGPQRLCSGELIAPTRFLTARHCTSFLFNNPALLGVAFDPTYNPGYVDLRPGDRGHGRPAVRQG